MKFEETETIFVPVYKDCFIYFLLQDEEVVYVGQTIQGILRPFSHKKDKYFNGIRLLYCEPQDLDRLEDEYLQKYQPVYNRCCNQQQNFSINKIKSLILDVTGVQYNITKVKKLLQELDIPLYKEPFQNTERISELNYNKLRDYLIQKTPSYNECSNNKCRNIQDLSTEELQKLKQLVLENSVTKKLTYAEIQKQFCLKDKINYNTPSLCDNLISIR